MPAFQFKLASHCGRKAPTFSTPSHPLFQPYVFTPLVALPLIKLDINYYNCVLQKSFGWTTLYLCMCEIYVQKSAQNRNI